MLSGSYEARLHSCSIHAEEITIISHLSVCIFLSIQVEAISRPAAQSWG